MPVVRGSDVIGRWAPSVSRRRVARSAAGSYAGAFCGRSPRLV
jgi:hypothetical protein